VEFEIEGDAVADCEVLVLGLGVVAVELLKAVPGGLSLKQLTSTASMETGGLKP